MPPPKVNPANGTNSSSSLEDIKSSKSTKALIESRGCCKPLDPEQNRFLRNWDLATGTALIFVCFVSPYEVAFVASNQGSEFLKNGADALFWLNRLIDLLFVIDMVLQFFIVYTVQKGRSVYIVKDHKLIIKHYLQTWFPIDFISILPFDILGLFMGSGDVRQLRVLRVVRLLRLLKLARLVRGLRLLKRWEVEISISYRRLTAFRLVMTVLIWAHWISCLLGIINGLQGDVCTGFDDDAPDCTMTWFSPASKDIADKGEEMTSDRRYIISLYVAATVLVHPHVMPPQNEWERLPFVLLIFMGGFIWTRVISRSTALITSMDRHTIHFHQTMDDLNASSSDKGLPHPLRRRLRAFFMNTRDSSQRQTWNGILGRMSPELKLEVMYETSKDWIRRVRYLAGTSKLFLQDVTLHLQTHLYSAKETFGENFMMYILRSGMCNWTKGQGKMCIMRPGDVWGEEHLFLTNFELLRPNTSTTISFTEVLSLSRDAFEKVYADYPEYAERMRTFQVFYICVRGILVYVQKEKEKEKVQRSRTNLSLSDGDGTDSKGAGAHRMKEKRDRRRLQKIASEKNPSSVSQKGQVVKKSPELKEKERKELEQHLTTRLDAVDARQAEFSVRLDAVHGRIDQVHSKQAALENLIRDEFAALSARLNANDELLHFFGTPTEPPPKLPLPERPPLPPDAGVCVGLFNKNGHRVC